MTRRLFSLLLIGLGATGVLRAVGFLGGRGVLRAFAAQGNSGTPATPGQARRAIESAAVAARGGDPASCSALVESVFAYPHDYPRLPASLEGPVKQRIANAEVGYRTGQRGGVNTADLVSTFNGLADQFGLPDYAKTSVAQVRHLRTGLARGFPQFIGSGLSRPGAKVGDTINDTMSPAEAAYTAMVLADQKLLNPDYQVPPDKWDPRISVHTQPTRGKGAQASLRRASKNAEMWRSLSQAVSGLSPGDAAQLMPQALTGLGL